MALCRKVIEARDTGKYGIVSRKEFTTETRRTQRFIRFSPCSL
jgi:hypothetical protein